MFYARIGLLVLFSVQALSVAADAPELPSDFAKAPDGKAITEKDHAALGGGKIMVQLKSVKGSPVKQAVSIAVLEASPAAVYSVLLDYELHGKFMPYVKETKILGKEGGKTRVRYMLDFPWPVGNRFYVLRMFGETRQEEGAKIYVSRWAYEPGSGNVTDCYGSFEVVAYGQKKTLLRYTCFMDPGGSIPKWTLNLSTTRGVTKVIQNLRKRLNGKYSLNP